MEDWYFHGRAPSSIPRQKPPQSTKNKKQGSPHTGFIRESPKISPKISLSPPKKKTPAFLPPLLPLKMFLFLNNSILKRILKSINKKI